MCRGVFVDYFSIIVLIVITFVFITDRRIKSKLDLDNKIVNELNTIKKNFLYLKLNFESLSFEELINSINNSTYDYIFLESELLNLDESKRELLISNFINTDKKMCGFNVEYIYEDNKKISLKKVFINVINYLNIFNRKDLSTYGVVILKKEDIKKLKLLNNRKIYCKEIISYVQSKNEKLLIYLKNIDKKEYYDLFKEKIRKTEFSIIFKFFLLLITGSLITTRIIQSSINIRQNLAGFIISLTIYLCYSYIIKFIYEPMGKQKIIASYIFPIYFVIYFYVLFFVPIIKKNNKEKTI